MQKRKAEISVRGLVQGVGFRYWTRQNAQQLGLSGRVRNETDGSVSIIAEGPEEAVTLFIARLHEGPPSAKVEEVIPTTAAATESFLSFEIER